jgi:hypothetical protein
MDCYVERPITCEYGYDFKIRVMCICELQESYA